MEGICLKQFDMVEDYIRVAGRLALGIGVGRGVEQAL